MESKETELERLPQRILWVDACKGIAILLVLLGHNNPPFVRLIYGFHMPLFFILSGYIYKDKHTKLSFTEELIHLLKGYIIPYLIFGCINMLLHIVHLRQVVPETIVSKEMILKYWHGLLTVNTSEMPCCFPMWFLPAFAIAMFVFYIIRNLPRRDLRFFIFAIVLIVSYFYCNGHRLLNMQAVVPGVLFLEVGYILKHIDLIESHILSKPRGERRLLYIAKLLTIIFFLLGLSYACIHFNPVQPRVDMSYGTYGNIFLFFLGGISASFVVMLSVIVLGTVNRGIIKPFAFLGLHTVFFMAFDESTNSWGGTILQNIYGSSYSPSWYVAFPIRITLIAIYFVIWLIILKVIPPLKKLTHS